jgi:thioester reductase-like protein
MGDVLFTGYPGFLGSALLPLVLARRPGSAAVCVVQEAYLPAARRRLAEQDAAAPGLADRVRLLVGDIAAPGLGLQPPDVAAVEEVFHLAAVYDLAVGADTARRVNEDGTRNVLDVVSGLPRLQRLQYVSTCYVAGRHPGVFTEEDLDTGQVHQNFYEETKFRAEVLVRQAMADGLPASIYRPGIVVGDSQTGETQKFDGPYYIARLLSMQPKHALVPRFGDPDRVIFSMVPRDFVIQAIDALSVMPEAVGATYALTDPSAPTVRRLVETFADLLGRTVTWVPMPLRLGRSLMAVPGLEGLLGIPEETFDYFAFPTRFATTNAERDLAAAGVQCPPFEAYAPNLIRFYTEHPEISSDAMV